MRRSLIKYFKNIRMLEKVEDEKRDGFFNEYGSGFLDNSMRFEKDEFAFNIKLNSMLLHIYTITIFVDQVKVYEDQWLHHAPSEMKEKMKEIIREIKSFNRVCRKGGLQRRYNVVEKAEWLTEKQRKRERYEEEREALINRFSQE